MDEKFDQLELGAFKAEPLKMVYSIRDGEKLLPSPDGGFTKDGFFQVRMARAAGHDPKDTEALRKRYTLMGVCWCFLAARHPTKPAFQGITPRLYEPLLDFLLGPDVLGLLPETSYSPQMALASHPLL